MLKLLNLPAPPLSVLSPCCTLHSADLGAHSQQILRPILCVVKHMRPPTAPCPLFWLPCHVPKHMLCLDFCPLHLDPYLALSWDYFLCLLVLSTKCHWMLAISSSTSSGTCMLLALALCLILHPHPLHRPSSPQNDPLSPALCLDFCPLHLDPYLALSWDSFLCLLVLSTEGHWMLAITSSTSSGTCMLLALALCPILLPHPLHRPSSPQNNPLSPAL